jgi:hypothetical protein
MVWAVGCCGDETEEVAVLPEAVCVAVIVVVPTATAVTSPAALTVATPGEDETKVDPAVRLAVEESLYVPVTVSCCVAPGASVELAGVTAMETRVGATLPPTAKTVAVAIRPEAVCVATMVVLPAETPVTRPPTLTVATPGEDETKVDPAVRLAVEESLYSPDTVSCSVPRTATWALGGMMSMATSVGASEDTVTVTLAVRPEAAAVMVAEPSASPVTTPELLTAATAEASEEKVRPAVMRALVPSLWIAVRTSCPTPPTASRRGLGVTAIADRVALLEPPQPGRRSPGRTARATSNDCL